MIRWLAWLGLSASACVAPIDILAPHDFAPHARVVMHDGAYHVIVDGVAGPPFAGIGEVRFAPTGDHIAYVASPCRWSHDDERPRCGASERWSVVWDGAIGASWHAASDLAFSEDGAHLAYAVAEGSGRMRVVDDRVIGPSVAMVLPGSLVRAAAHLAYAVRRGDRVIVVHDGRMSGPWEDVGVLRFDGLGRLVYPARTDDGWYLVVDGRRDGPWTESTPAVVAAQRVSSPDGMRWARVARRGDKRLVVSDRGERAFELIVDGTLTFSSDGRRWGCVAGTLAEHRLYVASEDRPDVPITFRALVMVADTAGPYDVAARDAAIRRWLRQRLDRSGP